MAQSLKLGSPSETGRKPPANQGGKTRGSSNGSSSALSVGRGTLWMVGGTLGVVVLAALLWWIFSGRRPTESKTLAFPGDAAGPPIPGPPGATPGAAGMNAAGGAAPSPGRQLGPNGPPIPGPPGK